MEKRKNLICASRRCPRIDYITHLLDTKMLSGKNFNGRKSEDIEFESCRKYRKDRMWVVGLKVTTCFL